MKMLSRGKRPLLMGLILTLIAGCGDPQAPIGGLGATSQAMPIAAHQQRGGLAMLPEAKSQDLIYATGGCGGVCIVTYPGGKLQAQITLSFPVGGDCSDSSGNVFVTNNGQVLKFAHGGTSPIATLTLPDDAGACSVDPKTGNLAVTCCSASAGNIAIFEGAAGTPTMYNAGNGASYVGYDDRGNLFVSGYINGQNALSELRSASASFVQIRIRGKSGGPGQVQWDGKYITLQNQIDHESITRLRVSGTTATVVGKTALKGPKWATQSWIDGNSVITPYSSRGGLTNKIGAWSYPKGGKIAVRIGTLGQPPSTEFFGVTVSVAPSQK